MNNLQVTLILASYNHAEYIEQSIRSVLYQTYKNIQLIVIDDFSSDGSIGILKTIKEKNDFVLLLNEKNEGLNVNILKALNYATGDFVALLASDDYISLNKIERQVDYLQNTGKDGVYANAYTFDKIKEYPYVPNPLFMRNNKAEILDHLYKYDWGGALIQSALFKTSLFKKLSPLREDFKSDDWAFIIKCYESYEIGYMEEPLVHYRLHINNTHKKYWFTFPMRVDIISRIVPEHLRIISLSNIMHSQGSYLINDKHLRQGLRFYMASIFLNFTFKKIGEMIWATAAYFKSLFKNHV